MPPGQTALLNGTPLPYDPDRVSWGYKANLASFDTLGGRVVQLLSIRINSMSLQGDAGTRAKLLALYDRVADIMQWEADMEMAGKPSSVRLVLPQRRDWVWSVYVTQLPQMGWDVNTVSFPYQITFEVDEDFSQIVPASIHDDVISRLADSIGYKPEWHGPTGNFGPDQQAIVDKAITQFANPPTASAPAGGK